MTKKATGIVRQLDSLGRVVIPMELRRHLDISEKDPLAIFVNDDEIILAKYEPGCIFCGNASQIIHYKHKTVCEGCLDDLSDKLSETVLTE